MATHEMPVGLGQPDTSGEVFPSLLSVELATSAKRQECMVFQSPSGSDPSVELAFRIPQNYAGSPVIVLRGVIDGTPANTLGVRAQQLSRDVSEGNATAYETEDTASNATWTGYADEDEYEETIALTPDAAYVAGDTIYLQVGRDDSADDSAVNFLVTEIFFQYSDT